MIRLDAAPFGPFGRPGRSGHASSSVSRPSWIFVRSKRFKTILACSLLAVLVPVAAALTIITVMLYRIRPTVPTASQIAAFEPVSATTIYSSDGVLLATLQTENRKPVSLKEVSPCLIQATLAVEDTRFYEHNGVDVRGVGRALLANITSHDAGAQGGSTITQQLARNISKFGLSKEKSISRKLKEMLTAVRIEQVFDKDTILELYLNQIYYGSGAYGVEAASRTFFGKPAIKLDLAEAALLAGLPQRPIALSPYTNPNGALNRRNIVLKRMLDTNRISVAQYERAKSQPLTVVPRKVSRTIGKAPYFVDWVTKSLVDRYGMDAVYSGWKIVTTLDWRMQERAEQAVRKGMNSGATQGALVSIDPHNGEVRAMVGGVNYQNDQFNATTQGLRQPGSAFKPFVYAAAFENGSLSLESKLKDAELVVPASPKDWRVRNSSGTYSNKDVTVLEAITHSINTVAVEAAQETGLSSVMDTAKRMGITSEMAPYFPLALGSSAVRPIELCEAYGVFASGGNRYQPTGIRSIEDNVGRSVEFGAAANSFNVLQSNTIGQIHVALRSVVTNGTGTAASGVPNAFGKTGTTSDNRDAWFVGYTPELVTAVWVANPTRDKQGRVSYAVMPGATGGHVAAPIWAAFMGPAVSIQQRVNKLRGIEAWAINLPERAKPQTQTLVLDETTNAYLKGVAPTEQPIGDTSVQTADYNEVNNRSVQRPAGLEERVRDSQEERATVRVCSETGQLATEWCDTTMLIDIAASSRTPSGYCRKHHAPFGEPR